MTEQEYTLLSNRVIISNALSILGNILPGDDNLGDLGITDEELAQVTDILRTSEKRIFARKLIDDDDVLAHPDGPCRTCGYG